MDNTREIKQVMTCTECGRMYRMGFRSLSPLKRDEAPSWLEANNGAYWRVTGGAGPCECGQDIFEEMRLSRP